MGESDSNRQFTSKSKRPADLVAGYRRTLSEPGVRPSDYRRITLGEWLVLGHPPLELEEAIS